MWSHFILALSVLAIFIECRPEQNNKKLKVAKKYNSEEHDLELAKLDEYYNDYWKKPEEKKVI
jgi:hypothetical protein